MMKTKILLAAIAVAATPALVAPAFADDDDRDDWDDWRGGKRGAMMMNRMDANSDGVLTKDEFLSRKTAMFTRIDTSGDGALSREEFGAGFRGPGTAAPAGMQAMHQAMTDRRFRAYDADMNGSISIEEFTAMPAMKFSMMDTNGDGQIVRGEMGPGMFGGGPGMMGGFCDGPGRHGGFHGRGGWDRD